MKLRRNGIFGRWYHWNYDHYTCNFCTYFWGSLWALLWLPVTITSIWFRNADGLMHRALIGFATWIGLVLASVITFGIIQDPWSAAKFFGGVVGGVLALGLIIGGGFWLSQSTAWDETVDIISTKKDSIKNNYCPKIHWIE